MRMLKVVGFLVVCVVAINGLAFAGIINLEFTGDGVQKDGSIKAGKPVSVDVMIENDGTFTGFSFGFSVVSPDSGMTIIHVADSGNGLNPNGDIKGHNGWEDHSIWNFSGVFAVEKDWDGVLPELLGFGGLSVQREYKPHEMHKVLSFDVIFPEAGTVTIDSAFFPPGGRWLFAAPNPEDARVPDWGGPYTLKIVK